LCHCSLTFYALTRFAPLSAHDHASPRALWYVVDRRWQFEGDLTFLHNIEGNTKRYVKLFASAADELMPLPVSTTAVPMDALDVAADFRRRHLDIAKQAAEAAGTAAAGGPQTTMPADLNRRFYVNVIPQTTSKAKSIREIRAMDLGGLVSVRGIVTRVTDVKPLCTVATYTCDACGHEIYQPVCLAFALGSGWG
jgi:DNA replication licensing factor MCM7